MDWKIIRLGEVGSTNSYISNNVAETCVVVTADYQSAGRGQGSNRWESEACSNLLFSLKVSPGNVPANRQFVLSMAGALALKDTLDAFSEGFTLKWPNDIYWHDRKISGTLIETTISGKMIQDCIFGVGLNVNQREFLSDAPNPVSLWQILGRQTDLEELLRRILDNFWKYFSMVEAGQGETVYRLYNDRLYRREGFHAYEDCDGVFEAEIVEVAHNGHLVLRDRQGRQRQYELKEVKFVIN